ncbi:hypothetical protein CBR_g19257 [Chara braunii]|uniref:Capsule synthesis protein CapA domain-containing protein n=1 Tax=Chara braunii TaxID=69332 RepID=A0A388JTR8_CHABU|nr:hypothetical protein CBR_g19257 [Chara braunii]|eukprot:GBG61181.1 hypothetical protein CBR_g19257 [Chara braunii]
MYTNLPHDRILNNVAKAVDEAHAYALQHTRMYSRCRALNMFIHGPCSGQWTTNSGPDNLSVSQILQHLRFVVENTFLYTRDGTLRKQIIGIPMGTNAGPEISNLTIYWDEARFIDDIRQHDPQAAQRYAFTYRLIDDVLSWAQLPPPSEHYLEWKEITATDGSCTFLGMHLRVRSDGSLRMSVFDKAAAWDFPVIRYPSATSNIPSHQPAVPTVAVPTAVASTAVVSTAVVSTAVVSTPGFTSAASATEVASAARPVTACSSAANAVPFVAVPTAAASIVVVSTAAVSTAAAALVSTAAVSTAAVSTPGFTPAVFATEVASAAVPATEVASAAVPTTTVVSAAVPLFTTSSASHWHTSLISCQSMQLLWSLKRTRHRLQSALGWSAVHCFFSKLSDRTSATFPRQCRVSCGAPVAAARELKQLAGATRCLRTAGGVAERFMALSGDGKVSKVLVVGDVMLGRLVDQLFPTHNYDPADEGLGVILVRRDKESLKQLKEMGPYLYVWGDTLALFHSVDLRLVNLETSVTTSSEEWPEQAFNFRMHPANVRTLKEASIDYCSLANNHILDFQVSGMRETMRTLTEAGIKFAGCGENLDQASSPAYLQLGNKKVACLSAADHFDYWAAGSDRPGIQYIDPRNATEDDLLRVQAKAEEARRNGADMVFMSFHWGPNWSWEPSGAIKTLAHQLVDRCGINLIHGHSAHHVQGVEIYKGTPIIYGCGDFIDDYAVDRNMRNDLGCAFVLVSTEDGGESREPRGWSWSHMELYPTKIHNLAVTQKLTNAERKWVVAKMTELSAVYGTEVLDVDGKMLIPIKPIQKSE